jgi:hypothetical protein
MSITVEWISMKTDKRTEYTARLVFEWWWWLWCDVPPYKCLCLKSLSWSQKETQRGHDVVDIGFIKQKLNQHCTFVNDLITTRECTMKSAGVPLHKFPRSTLSWVAWFLYRLPLQSFLYRLHSICWLRTSMRTERYTRRPVNKQVSLIGKYL